MMLTLRSLKNVLETCIPSQTEWAFIGTWAAFPSKEYTMSVLEITRILRHSLSLREGGGLYFQNLAISFKTGHTSCLIF